MFVEETDGGMPKVLIALLGAFIALSCVVLFYTVNQTLAVSGPTPVCPTGFYTIINNNTSATTTTAQTVTGIANVMFATSTNNASTISRVAILENGTPIGIAKPANSSSWTMPWATALSANGAQTLQSQVFMSSGASCVTAPSLVNIQNPVGANLVIVTQPPSWTGPLSFSIPITSNIRVQELNFDVTPYAIYEYSTSIGSITPNGPNAQYFSGNQTGSGTIAIRAIYGGKTINAKIPVTVASATAPLPAPTTSSSGSGSNSSGTGTSGSSNTQTTSASTQPAPTTATGTSQLQQTTVAARTAVLANNTSAQDCAVTALGKDRFEAINSGNVRPSTEELKKLNACFASSNFILPSNFAPVAPNALKSLVSSNDLKIEKLTNDKITLNSSKKDALKITGKAKPNSAVILYVFSEPLVLTTTADANGNWTYSLQDPIESGKHEVYAVVDRGDGTYQKSDPFNFVIGTAQAAAENPNKLSLTLAAEPTPVQTNRSLLLYIAGAVLIVSLVIIITLVILIRSRRKPPTPPANMLPPDAPAPPTTPTMYMPQNPQQ